MRKRVMKERKDAKHAVNRGGVKGVTRLTSEHARSRLTVGIPDVGG